MNELETLLQENERLTKLVAELTGVVSELELDNEELEAHLEVDPETIGVDMAFDIFPDSGTPPVTIIPVDNRRMLGEELSGRISGRTPQEIIAKYQDKFRQENHVSKTLTKKV